MPQLKRLVASASDAAVVAPEQLFARALHDQAQQQTRKDAAAVCAARAYAMASALGGEDHDCDLPLRDMSMPPRSPATMSMEESLHKAVSSAYGDSRPSLFIVDNAVYVVKRIRNTLESESVEASAREQILGRIALQQTREIHVLLSVLQDVQCLDSNRPAHVFIGPLSSFFTPFLTTNGLTTTGDGLLRMVQLACKRLQISHPGTDVTIIRDRPQFES